MSTVGKNIAMLRKKLGWTQAELAEKIGYKSNTTINKIELGINDIPQSKIVRFAEILGVSPMELMGWGEKVERNTPVGDPYPANIFPIHTTAVPLLGEIACGKPIYADERRGEYVNLEDGVKADFCLRAKGDSMVGARILDGDIVFCQEAEMVDNGEIAAVVIGDEATLKRVYYFPAAGKLVLSPENPSFEPIVLIGSELEGVKIIGKAVAFQSTLVRNGGTK